MFAIWVALIMGEHFHWEWCFAFGGEGVAVCLCHVILLFEACGVNSSDSSSRVVNDLDAAIVPEFDHREVFDVRDW